jgi:hypothetical protein
MSLLPRSFQSLPHTSFRLIQPSQRQDRRRLPLC